MQKHSDHLNFLILFFQISLNLIKITQFFLLQISLIIFWCLINDNNVALNSKILSRKIQSLITETCSQLQVQYTWNAYKAHLELKFSDFKRIIGLLLIKYVEKWNSYYAFSLTWMLLCSNNIVAVLAHKHFPRLQQKITKKKKIKTITTHVRLGVFFFLSSNVVKFCKEITFFFILDFEFNYKNLNTTKLYKMQKWR